MKIMKCVDISDFYRNIHTDYSPSKTWYKTHCIYMVFYHNRMISMARVTLIRENQTSSHLDWNY